MESIQKYMHRALRQRHKRKIADGTPVSYITYKLTLPIEWCRKYGVSRKSWLTVLEYPTGALVVLPEGVDAPEVRKSPS